MLAEMPDWLLTGIAALFGLCMGSFASLLAYRLPRGLPVIAGRSCCPACAKPLRARDLAPLLSYLWNRGRCAQCGANIGRRYPLIELAAAASSMLAVMAAGPGLDAVLLALLAAGLLVVIAVDLEFMIIPDAVLMALALLGGAYRFPEWMDAAGGAAIAAGVALGLRFIFTRLKGREALGLGDVKFFAMAGIWCGTAGLASFMMLSGVFGIVFALGWRVGRKPDHALAAEFPFGPALAAGLYVVLLLKQTGSALGEF